MYTIEGLLAFARTDSTCIFFPTEGLPVLAGGHILPQDLATFYLQYGGGILFEDDYFPAPLVRPSGFVLANDHLLIGATAELLEIARIGITNSWYILSTWNGTEHICIDCHPQRLGRCYYTSSYTYAMQGESPIIAMSFTEFLGKTIANRHAEECYWEMPSFIAYGDAFR